MTINNDKVPTVICKHTFSSYLSISFSPIGLVLVKTT